MITLLLAVTDRFGKGYGVSDTQAKELLARLKGEYERAYYAGILAERRAKAKLAQGTSRRESLRLRWLSRRDELVRKGGEQSGPPGTTMRFCAGTPARASSRKTNWSRAKKSASNRPGVSDQRRLKERRSSTADHIRTAVTNRRSLIP